jgi:hypothetical protein
MKDNDKDTALVPEPETETEGFDIDAVEFAKAWDAARDSLQETYKLHLPLLDLVAAAQERYSDPVTGNLNTVQYGNWIQKIKKLVRHPLGHNEIATLGRMSKRRDDYKQELDAWMLETSRPPTLRGIENRVLKADRIAGLLDPPAASPEEPEDEPIDGEYIDHPPASPLHTPEATSKPTMPTAAETSTPEQVTKFDKLRESSTPNTSTGRVGYTPPCPTLKELETHIRNHFNNRQKPLAQEEVERRLTKLVQAVVPDAVIDFTTDTVQDKLRRFEDSSEPDVTEPDVTELDVTELESDVTEPTRPVPVTDADIVAELRRLIDELQSKKSKWVTPQSYKVKRTNILKWVESILEGYECHASLLQHVKAYRKAIHDSDRRWKSELINAQLQANLLDWVANQLHVFNETVPPVGIPLIIIKNDQKVARQSVIKKKSRLLRNQR